MLSSSQFDPSALLESAGSAAQQICQRFQAATQEASSAVIAQLNREIQARQQQANQIRQLTTATTRDQTQQWNSVFTQMNRGFSRTVTQMTGSSRSLQQEIGRVLDQILADLLRTLERMVANWIAQHLFMQTFGMATQKASASAAIAGSAAEGAAAAYASAAAIPVVGWTIAPAVAADAYSNILAFEGLNAFAAGGIVPSDSLAYVHKNEMVLPASLSAGLSNLVASGSGGGDTHVHFNVSATDAKSFEGRLEQHADTLVRLLRRAWRHGKI